jgi:hypothetical protein
MVWSRRRCGGRSAKPDLREELGFDSPPGFDAIHCRSAAADRRGA